MLGNYDYQRCKINRVATLSLSFLFIIGSLAHARLEDWEPKRQICQRLPTQIHLSLDMAAWDESCLAGDFELTPVKVKNEAYIDFNYLGTAQLTGGAKKSIFCSGTVYQNVGEVYADCN